MYILVDYDNIDQTILKEGIKYVLERIADALNPQIQLFSTPLLFRLYGGWYDERTPTTKAQELTRTLQDDDEFPFEFQPLTRPQASQRKIIIQAELAYSLLSSPEKHLFNTYRQRETLSGLRVKSPESQGCQVSDCGLRHLRQLVRKGRCPVDTCTLTNKELLWKAEQKLVDVMLASDLFFLVSSMDTDPIAIVSSDDDIWPAIQQAINFEAKIIHIQGKLFLSTPVHYTSLVESQYYTPVKLGG